MWARSTSDISRKPGFPGFCAIQITGMHLEIEKGGGNDMSILIVTTGLLLAPMLGYLLLTGIFSMLKHSLK